MAVLPENTLPSNMIKAAVVELEAKLLNNSSRGGIGTSEDATNAPVTDILWSSIPEVFEQRVVHGVGLGGTALRVILIAPLVALLATATIASAPAIAVAWIVISSPRAIVVVSVAVASEGVATSWGWWWRQQGRSRWWEGWWDCG